VLLTAQSKSYFNGEEANVMNRRRYASLLSLAFFALFIVIGTSPRLVAAQDQPPAQPEPDDLPFFDRWLSSAHADLASPAFSYWNNLQPPLIPKGCAKCHSRTGFEDFLGLDGSAPGQVDRPHETGTVVDCAACHNEGFADKTTVLMPSGIEMSTAADEKRCMECHQGRQSGAGIDAMIVQSAVSLDVVSDALDFARTHNDPGISLKYGTTVTAGYEYEGRGYDAEFTHVEGYRICTDCHDSFSLKVKVAECQQCHLEIATTDDLTRIRTVGASADFNGNGNVTEGIAAEISALQNALLQNIKTYARQISTRSIGYSSDHYPNFFIDADRNGQLDDSELGFENRYNAWTPRLLRAAYNYESSMSDRGAYSHNAKYVIQLLYDSIASLNAAIWDPIDMSLMERDDSGHFAGSHQSFRTWDDEGEVPRLCAKCHSAQGLPSFLQNGVNVSQPPSNGFDCGTCHNDLTTFTLHQVRSVVFPSGATISSGHSETNLCMSCHQGRYGIAGLTKLIGDRAPDEQSADLCFVDAHNFAAAATRYGSEAKSAYEYPGKSYQGFADHGYEYFNQCTDCHRTHALEVRKFDCVNCHEEIDHDATVRDIRFLPGDFDGDGDDREGIYYEIVTLQSALYTQIQQYANDVADQPIVYVPTGYPYFFNDLNRNGMPDRAEITADNAYDGWTPRLLRAAYNYQNSLGDPGAFAHNSRYIIQTLYDSIDDLGGDASAMIRP
jgi:hypothetical protein